MRTLTIPEPIRAALESGAALIPSVSGGKDSQAMLAAVARAWRVAQWPGPLRAVHSHLGRAEWPQTLGVIEAQCARHFVPLTVVRREQGDLVDRIEARKEKLAGTGRPFWPSAASRYCTAELKRGPIQKFLRQHRYVVSCHGIRAAESPVRAKKPEWEMETALCTVARRAFIWRPILHWSAEEVWEACGTSLAELHQRQEEYRLGRRETALEGWPCHPAYVFGNQRLSCALCILAGANDLKNGIRHNPELAQIYMSWERETGFTFQQGRSLSSLLDQGELEW
jgi:3'-phosphoadenosine 5'-phosphosulfate sulfotransferase (PAPS reductase)/FAD synthetase